MLSLGACSSDEGSGDGDSPGDGDVGDGDVGDGDVGDGDASFSAPSGEACAPEERLGSLYVFLGEDYTSFSGGISDGVVPSGVSQVLQEDGSCRLMGVPNLFCEETCASGETCGAEGECIVTPLKVSAGTLTVSGLEKAVSLEPSAFTVDYSITFDDPYPGVVPGAEVIVSASGDVVPSFVLTGRGVEAISSSEEQMHVESGKAATVTWDAPSETVADTFVFVKLTVNTHGGTSAWIECTFDDTGTAEIPEPLVTELMTTGLSGFPRATISRRTSDHVEVMDGCVDFRVTSDLEMPVEIPGLTSCSGNEDCPDGQTCNEELYCEEG